MNALIVAAGLGTRLRPFTETMPKALVPVGGRPMIETQIIKLKKAGFDHIVINVHHFAEQIIDYVASHDFGIDIRISDERNLLLDTGGAVRKAMKLFPDNSPVLIHNVDIFSTVDIRAFYDAHCTSDSDASLLVSSRTTSRYLLFDADMHLTGWENIKTGEYKPVGPSRFSLTIRPQQDASDFLNGWKEKDMPYAFAGIHIVSSTLCDALATWPDVFSIIDFYLSVAATHIIQGIVAPPDFQLVDAGRPEMLPLAATLAKR